MEDSNPVWRYMGFSRFMWMLQRQQLWLSRADKLDDPWELQLTNEEIEHIVRRHPIWRMGEPEPEPALVRTKRILDTWRTTTFINCWCASWHESHALWRVFCGPKEGIAVKSTWGKLSAFADYNNFRLVEVDYSGYDGKLRTPNIDKVSIRKRHMFEYEHEVRMIAYDETPSPLVVRGEFGYQIAFDPAALIDEIIVHPEADQSFEEVVVHAVDTYATAIRERVQWSSMKEPPPAIIIGAN